MSIVCFFVYLFNAIIGMNNFQNNFVEIFGVISKVVRYTIKKLPFVVDLK